MFYRWFRRSVKRVLLERDSEGVLGYATRDVLGGVVRVLKGVF